MAWKVLMEVTNGVFGKRRIKFHVMWRILSGGGKEVFIIWF